MSKQSTILRDYGPTNPRHSWQWIKQIAESELATVLRRAKQLKHGGNRNQLLPGPVTGGSAVILLGEVEARSPGPRSWVAREEAVDRLRLGISALPTDQRRVVELCYAQGMNRADVGKAMNRSVGAVRTLLMRAKQRLREFMKSPSLWLD